MAHPPGGITIDEYQIEGFVRDSSIDKDDMLDLNDIAIYSWNALKHSDKHTITLSPIEYDLLSNKHNWRYFAKIMEGVKCKWEDNKEWKITFTFLNNQDVVHPFAKIYNQEAIRVREEKRKIERKQQEERMNIERKQQEERDKIEEQLRNEEYNNGRSQLSALEKEYKDRYYLPRSEYNWICHPNGEGWAKLCRLREKFETQDEKMSRLALEEEYENEKRIKKDNEQKKYDKGRSDLEELEAKYRTKHLLPEVEYNWICNGEGFNKLCRLRSTYETQREKLDRYFRDEKEKEIKRNELLKYHSSKPKCSIM